MRAGEVRCLGFSFACEHAMLSVLLIEDSVQSSLFVHGCVGNNHLSFIPELSNIFSVQSN